MPRFFLSTALHVGETVALPGDVVRHLKSFYSTATAFPITPF